MTNLTDNLHDIGCNDKTITQVGKLLDNGSNRQTVIELKKYKATLLDELHQKQRQIDRLDNIIRKQEELLK